jgi:spore germination protein YaaH
MLTMKKHFLFALFLYLFPALSPIYAQELYVSGWLPYWREDKAIESATANITLLDEINPFIYTVKQSGELHNNVSLHKGKWHTLRLQAEAPDTAFIPTLMWAGRDAIYNVLKDETKRKAHIRSILQEVYRYDFDGIDIDYENKSAETRLYFSLFLKELREAMGYDREIICTIESRMPVEDRYSKGADIPTFIEYANDFTQINQYCDRVRVMAYDQGRADLTLNEERPHPYAPVADTYWVEK